MHLNARSTIVSTSSSVEVTMHQVKILISLVLVLNGVQQLHAIKMWPCVNIAGTSDSVGSGCPATRSKDQLATRAGDISKINIYYDGKCVTGETDPADLLLPPTLTPHTCWQCVHIPGIMHNSMA
jgi:hypothetical protein